MKKNILSFILLVLSLTLSAQSYTKQIKEFDAYIQKGMKDWEIPGMAVVVVKDNKVLLKKGYGVKELGKSAPVDINTLFVMASTTKALTAVGMGMLVDEGKVKWSDRVIDHLPELHLFDSYVTKELRIKDLFTHNSGVGNSDFLWTAMQIPSDEIINKMEFVEPSYSFRGGYTYQNIFYLMAGMVIEKISGQSWAEYTKEKIFIPLGMNRSQPLKSLTDGDLNLASPHDPIKGKVTVIQHSDADAIAPAGSAWSTADDISKWVICMLDSSKYSGGRLLKPNTWKEMFTPQIIIPYSQFYPSKKFTQPNWTTYALGWFQHDYKGKKVNFHTGSLFGSIAIHGQLPEEKLGIYVFANYGNGELRHALMYKAFDLFALGGDRDWSKDLLKLYTTNRNASAKRAQEFIDSRVLDTTPSHSLDAYAGKYTDPLYGELVISVSGDKLTIEVNKFLRATVTHWHYDTFRGDYEKAQYGTGLAQFTLNSEGKAIAVDFDGMDFSKAKQ